MSLDGISDYCKHSDTTVLNKSVEKFVVMPQARVESMIPALKGPMTELCFLYVVLLYSYLRIFMSELNDML